MGLFRENVLPSQVRLITYVDKGVAAVAKELEEYGTNPAHVAQVLEPAVDTALEIQDHVLYPAGTHVHTCWELANTQGWLGKWLIDGGPLVPVEDTQQTLLRYMPGTVNCRAYFEALAALELKLGRQLRAALRGINAYGPWTEVLGAAADHANTMANPEIKDEKFRLPWWVWAGGAAAIGWMGLQVAEQVGNTRRAWRGEDE